MQFYETENLSVGSEENMKNRKWKVNYWIKTKLVDIMYYAKNDNKSVADDDIKQLRGMLTYMRSVGDINDETFNRVYKLSVLIKRKYNIYE